jgi:outer membrane murein-binding lipoprotein Lpp
MVDAISISFGVCMLFGVCCVAAAHERSNEKLDTIASKLHAISANVNDLNTAMKEKERKRKRKETNELECARRAFMTDVRV